MSSHEQSMSEASSSAAATAATANDDAPNAAAVDTEQFRALYEHIDLLDKKIKATQRAEKEAPPAQAVIDLAAVLHAYKSIGALVGEMPRDIIIAAGAALVYKQARPMVLEVNSTATGSFLLLVLAIFFVMQFHKMRCLCEKLDGRA